MTNYEKYVGTYEKLADFIICLSNERTETEIMNQFCKGDCEDGTCTDEALKGCIVHWLDQNAD